MDPDRWSRIQQLYHQALELDADRREAFLAGACGDDRSLRGEIESLLDEDDGDGVFLEEPALAATARLVGDEIPALVGGPFGPYHITELLGTGGMGDVYRARDTVLARDVAIKILPEAFNDDPDRIARFEQEAQFLASLSHPNIAAIYGVHEAGGLRGLVLELVDGETLAQRLRRGPIPLYEVVRIARQIGEGLDAAHQRGIVHRDLKPSNIKIAADGTTKILDFGLAKSAAVSGSDGVLGTASYMSPEQARGDVVDKRADIWAFGCVCFEMLTGQPAFHGEATHSPTGGGQAGQIEPPWSHLPAAVPPGVVALLKRCIEEDPKRRRRDIGDVLVDLDTALGSDVAPQRTWLQPKWLLTAGALLVVGGAALMSAVDRRPAQPAGSSQARLSLLLPSGMDFAREPASQLAVSPDGTMIAYVAAAGGEASRLVLRKLNASSEQIIGDALDVRHPFFSPDSQWLGFFAGDTIRKVSVLDRRTRVIAQAPRGESATWASGFIFFGEAGDLPTAGIRRVPEDGGTVEVLSTPERQSGEINHLAPELLPDGRTVMYTVRRPYADAGSAWRLVVQVPGESPRVLLDDARLGRYLGNSVLVYQRGRSLMATTLDLQTLATPGPGVMLFDDVSANPTWAVGGGVLAYRPEDNNRRFVWVRRDGTAVSLPAPPKRYAAPSLSPRGDRIAVEIEEDGFDVWTLDAERPRLTKLTSGGVNRYPMWTPDGTHVGVVERRENFLYSQAPDRDGVRKLVQAALPIWLGSWTRDMRTLVYMLQDSKTDSDLWAIDIETHAARPLVQTQAREYGGRLSPDGRWLTYFSDESGQFELYLRPLASDAPRYRISTTNARTLARAREAVWSRDGQELFYRHGTQMMSVPVPAGTTSPPKPATVLFEGDYFATGGPGIVNYDVAPDGRFLMLKSVEDRSPHLSVVQGLDDLIRERLAPGNR
jgi:serine/threonine-protein kinase